VIIPAPCRGRKRHSSCISQRFPEGPQYRVVEEISEELDGPEAIVPVSGARVIIADYDAILHDFPNSFGSRFRRKYEPQTCHFCRSADLVCVEAIDAWIVHNAAFVSEQQANSSEVNTPINHGPAVLRGYRPPRYGRSMVVQVEEGENGESAGLFDLKGAGVAPGVEPVAAWQSNGLEYVAEALADFFYAKLVDRVFAVTVPEYWVVPIYAVLDLGFDVRNGRVGTAPAGLHVRRAHRRNPAEAQVPMSGSEEERVGLHMEMLIRTFGLSTSSPGTTWYIAEKKDGEQASVTMTYQSRNVELTDPKRRERAQELRQILDGRSVELTNWQLTEGASFSPPHAQIVDLGQVNARRLRLPFASTVRDTVFCIGRIIKPEDEAFSTPDPDASVDPDFFGRHVSSSFAHLIAHDFRNNRISSREVSYAFNRALRRTPLFSPGIW
jgi:hypothetical protein